MKNIRNAVRYGDSPACSLRLSPRAQQVYSQCDPLSIYELPDASFSIRGIEDRDDMTEDSVNRWLEELADDVKEEI